MNKYERAVRRKLTRLKPCPFCGKVPKASAHVDKTMSAHDSTGHWMSQEPCCSVMPMGRSHCFFTNNEKPADYALWKSSVDRFVDAWNRRHP